MGVFGGVKGVLEGLSMMFGGIKIFYEVIENFVNKMVVQVEDGFCVIYIGLGGLGYLVKIVYNGIEYGIEQIFVEGYDLMKWVKGMIGVQMVDVFG